MTLPDRWYTVGQAKIHNLHISVLSQPHSTTVYIVLTCEVKFPFNGISMLFPVY